MRKRERLKMDREICATVWTSPRAPELMQALGDDIGSRPAASQPYRDAVALLTRELTGIGCGGIHTEPVPIVAWQAGDSLVELIRPGQCRCESVHHVHSAPGDVSGALVDAGAGTPAELDRLGGGTAGAVLLVAGHEITGGKVPPIRRRVQDMAERGAAAILMRCMEPGLGPAIELASFSTIIPIPIVGISHEDGCELAAAAAAGAARVRVRATGRNYDACCENLVADLTAPGGGDGVIILSAHVDSFHNSPCALDNLSGVVTLVEIARALAPFKSAFRRTLRLIVFTGEEYGLVGSVAYVDQHAEELDAIQFVFNLDSLFDNTARGVAVVWAPAMRDVIEHALRETQRRVEVRDMFCMSSDYLPFMLAGIAVGRPADLEDAFPPYSHTCHDTLDKVPPEWIRLNAMAYAQMLARLLIAPKLPAKRLAPEQVQTLIDEQDAAAELWESWG